MSKALRNEVAIEVALKKDRQRFCFLKALILKIYFCCFDYFGDLIEITYILGFEFVIILKCLTQNE